jgi:hypothetical protein
MVNFGFGLAGIVGIALVAAGVGLYVLRSIRPTLARDHDIFFAAVALLCGGILMFQGWRLDPILLFGQFMMTGSAAFFAVESIRLRGIVTQQAKRSGGSSIDEERNVSSAYQTYNDYEDDVEELEPLDEYPPVRRIPGTRDSRRPAKETDEDERRRPANRRPSSSSARPTSTTGTPPRKRSDRPIEDPRRSSRYESWDNSGYDDRDSSNYDDRYNEKPYSSSSSRPTNGRGDVPPKPKRPRPSPSYRADDIEATPVDYVDYRPSKKPSLDRDDVAAKDYSDYSDYSDYTSNDEDDRPESRPTSPPPARNPKSDRTQMDRDDDEYRPPVRSNPKKNLDVTPPPNNYSEYQPVNYGDDEDDNSDNFDD